MSEYTGADTALPPLCVVCGKIIPTSAYCVGPHGPYHQACSGEPPPQPGMLTYTLAAARAEGAAKGRREGIEAVRALVLDAFMEGHSKGMSAGHDLSPPPDPEKDWEESWVIEDWRKLEEARDE